MKVKVQGEPKDIAIVPLTRGMSKAIKAALLKGITVTNDEFGATNLSPIPMENQTESEQLSVCLRTGLTSAEVDSLLDSDYLKVLKAIKDFDDTEKKREEKSSKPLEPTSAEETVSQ